jgi:hypothetical protein
VKALVERFPELRLDLRIGVIRLAERPFRHRNIISGPGSRGRRAGTGWR